MIAWVMLSRSAADGSAAAGAAAAGGCQATGDGWGWATSQRLTAASLTGSPKMNAGANVPPSAPISSYAIRPHSHVDAGALERRRDCNQIHIGLGLLRHRHLDDRRVREAGHADADPASIAD